MTKTRIGLICCSVAFILILVYVFLGAPNYELVIRDQETDEEYVRTEVHIGDVLQLSWRHSVELTLWIEYIEVIEGEKFKIIETRFESYGSGISPSTTGKVRVEDGYIVLSDLDQVHDKYRWIHSQKQELTLAMKENIILLPSDIPHHHKVEMILEKR